MTLIDALKNGFTLTLTGQNSKLFGFVVYANLRRESDNTFFIDYAPTVELVLTKVEAWLKEIKEMVT